MATTVSDEGAEKVLWRLLMAKCEAVEQRLRETEDAAYCERLEAKSEIAEARAELDAQRCHTRRVAEEISGLRQQLTRRERELSAQNSTIAALQASNYLLRQKAPTPPPATVPDDLVEDLIRLTHPDRHSPAMAALANRVTARLLGLRKSR